MPWGTYSRRMSTLLCLRVFNAMQLCYGRCFREICFFARCCFCSCTCYNRWDNAQYCPMYSTTDMHHLSCKRQHVYTLIVNTMLWMHICELIVKEFPFQCVKWELPLRSPTKSVGVLWSLSITKSFCSRFLLVVSSHIWSTAQCNRRIRILITDTLATKHRYSLYKLWGSHVKNVLQFLYFYFFYIILSVCQWQFHTTQ